MYFMRHGESIFNEVMNRTGRDPQIPDPPLTKRGEEQVLAAARRWAKPIDLIVTSPYTRAIQTAVLFAQTHSAPIFVDPVVGERRLYSCDIGIFKRALTPKWPELNFENLGTGIWWTPFPETNQQLKERAAQFQRTWAAEAAASRMMVISHWYFINIITNSGPENAEIVETTN